MLGNKQAFPIPETENHARTEGMTKREYFAAAALMGLSMVYAPHEAAAYAVTMADELLIELAK
jgi:hypothetical protein